MKVIIIHLILVVTVLILLAINIFGNSSSNQSEEEMVDQVLNSVSLSSDEKIVTLPKLEWKPYYNGGLGLDSIISANQNTESIRISTGVDGAWYGARAEFSPLDFTNGSIAFKVQAYNWEDLDQVIIMFSSDSDFKNYYTFNIKNYFTKPAFGEWSEVVIEPSVFKITEGVPGWNNINSLAIRVIPKKDVSTKIWFEEFELIPKINSEAVVSMTFDDGFSSTFKAGDIMHKYDYTGTAYIIPEFLGKEGYLIQAEVDDLAGMGWDISGHGKDNLTELVSADADTQLASVYKYLDDRKYKGREHFAYPNGGYNKYVESQVMEYFTSARTIDGFSQPVAKIHNSHINAVTISSSTPITDIIAQIDQAVKDKSWLILVWHNFNQELTSDTDYRLEDFSYLVDYINKNNIKVLPYSEAYKQFTTSI